MSNLRQFIGATLRQAAWGDTTRFTCPYDVFLALAKPGQWKTLQRRKECLQELLSGDGSNLLIFDVGANNGSKADLYRRLGARVICVEPDRTNVKTLTDRFRFRRNVTVVPKAIGDRPGEATLHIAEPGSAYNTLSPKQKAALESPDNSHFGRALSFAGEQKVEVTTLDRLIEEHGKPGFLKLDIEGYESLAFKGLSHRIPWIEFEANLPAFRIETLECIDRLHSLDPEVRFAWSASGEIERAIDGWIGHREFRHFVAQTDLGFLEIIARLEP